MNSLTIFDQERLADVEHVINNFNLLIGQVNKVSAQSTTTISVLTLSSVNGDFECTEEIEPRTYET